MQLLKTTALVISVLLVLAVSRQADAQLLDYGFRAGMNISSVTNSVYRTDSMTGYHFGMFASYNFRTLPIAIQPEMVYMQMGTKYDEIVVGFNTPRPATVRMNYIHIPLLLKAFLPLPGPVKPNLFGGPYVGFRSGVTFTVGGQEIPQAGDWYRDSDFGIVVGAGTRIRLMMVNLDLEARLVYGLENIFDSQFEYDEKHRAVSLSAAILF
jgi:hypothetical protein